jgi:hypothetical protein
MAGPVVTPLVYPTKPSEFFVLTAQRSSALMVLSSIQISIGGTDLAPVLASGVLDAGYLAGGSTLSGSGVLGDPYQLSLRPEGNWPITGTKIHSIAIQAEESALPVNSSGEPPGYELRMPLRQYQGFVNPLAVNLIANPLERAGVYAPVEAHQLVTSPQLASEITGWNTGKTRLLSLTPPMRTIPGFRIMASSGAADQWFDPVRIATATTNLGIIAALRFQFPGDTAVGAEIELDIEDYITGIEPNESNITGHTYAQFCTAWQSFFDLALSLVPIPVFITYPTVAWIDLQHMHLIQRRWVELAGRDYMHFVTESHGFLETVSQYRMLRFTSFPSGVLGWNQDRGNMERDLGGPVKMRTFIEDDILRDTGAEFTPAVYGAFGRMAPIIQDWNRADRLFWGTPGCRHWTAMSTANKRNYQWHGIPLSSARNIMSTGELASVALTTYRSTVTTGNEALGPATIDDLLGSRLKIQNGYVYGVWRVAGVMPTTTPQAWTIILEGQVPVEIVVDTPILSQNVSNLKLWQTYIRASDSHLIWERMLTGETHDLGAISRDTTFKLAIARNGNTDWRWSLNGSVAANFTAGATIGANSLVVVGGGAVPGSGTSNGSLMSCNRFLQISFGIAPNAFSDADLKTASDVTKPYPVGRGT